ncbi:hypothetical protein BH10PSE7_BH10PSE7_19710 [soil metagenome]
MILDPLLDLFRGRAVTIPPMDGALRPDTSLDESEVFLTIPAPDNLVVTAGRTLFSSGAQLLALPDMGSHCPSVATFESDIASLAAAPNGTIAAGLVSGEVHILTEGAAQSAIAGFNCPVAMTFGRDGTLYICNGSDRHPPDAWVHDVMGKNAAGSVWRVSLPGGERTCLADNLAFPFGVMVDEANGRLIVSESWRHRLIGIPLAGGKPEPVLANLPGYPARMAPGENGTLLAIFAPRNRLIEFVLLEDDYRTDMMRDVDSRYWIAPSLSSSRSFLEPLQNGSVRTMGIHKPWSPTRSYGLIVELDGAFQPVTSYHSRANGTRHGMTSAVMRDGRIVATSKGGDMILSVGRKTLS